MATRLHSKLTAERLEGSRRYAAASAGSLNGVRSTITRRARTHQRMTQGEARVPQASVDARLRGTCLCDRPAAADGFETITRVRRAALYSPARRGLQRSIDFAPPSRSSWRGQVRARAWRRRSRRSLAALVTDSTFDFRETMCHAHCRGQRSAGAMTITHCIDAIRDQSLRNHQYLPDYPKHVRLGDFVQKQNPDYFL